MGIGSGIFLIALGSIIAFAIHVKTRFIDLHVIGWVFILSGVSVLTLAIYFVKDRRRRQRLTLVETSLMERQHGAVPSEADAEYRLPPSRTP